MVSTPFTALRSTLTPTSTFGEKLERGRNSFGTDHKAIQTDFNINCHGFSLSQPFISHFPWGFDDPLHRSVDLSRHQTADRPTSFPGALTSSTSCQVDFSEIQGWLSMPIASRVGILKGPDPDCEKLVLPSTWLLSFFFPSLERFTSWPETGGGDVNLGRLFVRKVVHCIFRRWVRWGYLSFPKVQ